MGGIVAPEASLRYNFAGTILLGPVYPNEVLVKVLNDRIEKIQKGTKANRQLHFQNKPVVSLSSVLIGILQMAWMV